MKQILNNGTYNLAVAPINYPGKIYRKNEGLRVCCEHHLIWWKHTGKTVKKGYVIHHKDGNTKNNIFSNLEEIEKKLHCRQHAKSRGRLFVELECPTCLKIFIKEKSRTHLSKGGLSTSCCIKCARLRIKNKQKIIKEFRAINEGLKDKPILGHIIQ
jgi:hypothetical protein